jgi:glutamate racemase
LLEPLIKEVMGPEVKVISSGEETAREVSTILGHNDMFAVREELPEHSYYMTGSRTIFSSIASQWLEKPIENVEKIKLG